MNDKLYDFLCYLGRIVLPALSTLYVALADTWALPYKVEIATTIMAIDTFLNALLMISSNQYIKAQNDTLDLKEALENENVNAD